MQKSLYRVVTYRPEHASAWRSLNEGWIVECGFEIEPKDQKVLGDAQGQLIAPGGQIFMVEDESGTAVACCALMAMGEASLELAKMAVRTDLRGQGLSKLLMEACIAGARTVGAKRLYLETNSALAPALRLYEQFGFRYLPPRETPYARADVFMELWL